MPPAALACLRRFLSPFDQSPFRRRQHESNRSDLPLLGGDRSQRNLRKLPSRARADRRRGGHLRSQGQCLRARRGRGRPRADGRGRAEVCRGVRRRGRGTARRLSGRGRARARRGGRGSVPPADRARRAADAVRPRAGRAAGAHRARSRKVRARARQGRHRPVPARVHGAAGRRSDRRAERHGAVSDGGTVHPPRAALPRGGRGAVCAVRRRPRGAGRSRRLLPLRARAGQHRHGSLSRADDGRRAPRRVAVRRAAGALRARPVPPRGQVQGARGAAARRARRGADRLRRRPPSQP